MTPQEAKLIEELFDRLAALESAPRDAQAVRAINEGLKRAPNALYPLVQTALVQDEALKRADARIRELEAELGLDPGQPAKEPGFLDSMRDTLFGKPAAHGSVPTVRPADAEPRPAASPWGNTGANFSQPGGYGSSAPVGGSFLGTAAATAAGVVGGALLAQSLRGLFGARDVHGAFDPGLSGAAPWSPPASDSNLAREAGIDSIGHNPSQGADDRSQSAGLFDTTQDDGGGFGDDNGSFEDGDFDVGGDFGDDGSDAA